jgi:hypothetical protein
MSKKNKKNNKEWASSPAPQIQTPVPVKRSSTITVDRTVHKLLTSTAERNRVSVGVLVDLSVQAMLGSIETYGYEPTNLINAERNPIDGSIEGPTVTIPEKSMETIRAIALFFGAKTCDILRDAILGQRYNWQRLQPVNARSMSSIRLQMFELEQLGSHNR